MRQAQVKGLDRFEDYVKQVLGFLEGPEFE